MNLITIKDTSPNYSYINRADIQPGLEFGLDQFAQASYDNIYQILQIASADIEKYLILYNQAFLKFQRQNNIVRKIRALPLSASQNKQDNVQTAINVKAYQNKKQATLEFIQILEMGKYLLSKFRTLITGNSIQTKITIKTSNGVYLVDQHDIGDYITPILSTYGGSTQGNPFSLAYQIDIQLLQQKGILNETNKISNTNIYQEIWKQKMPYLMDIKGWPEKKAKKSLVFNSKDAEIYDLMTQMEFIKPGSTRGWLSVSKYEQLRASMGGGGGYRTSQLKSGDVGLIQDKMVTERQQSVNIIRQQMIKENLERLLIITRLPMSNPSLIKESLKKLFTENELNISDEITRQTNQEAQKIIDSLFK